MAGRLILLRHGQTHSNAKKILDTRPPGAELTELGCQQAIQAGIELAEFCEAEHGGPGRLVHICSSIAIRAQQTAMRVARSFEEAAGLAANSLSVEVLTGIHEIDAGEFELRSDEIAAEEYTKTFHGWLHGVEDSRLKGGENHLEVIARYRPVLEALNERFLKEDVDVIIASHGAAIRTISCHATGVDPEFAFGAYLANCKFVALEPQGQPFGSWKLNRWADADQQI